MSIALCSLSPLQVWLVSFAIVKDLATGRCVRLADKGIHTVHQAREGWSWCCCGVRHHLSMLGTDSLISIGDYFQTLAGQLSRHGWNLQ